MQTQHRPSLFPPRRFLRPCSGVAPTREALSSGHYPLGRPLFVYYKRASLDAFPTVNRYVDELASEPAWSGNGYLRQDGPVPMMLDERQKYAYIADNHVDPGCPPFCR